MSGFIIFLLCGAFFFFLIFIASTIFTIEQQTVAIIERFGKFQRMAKPGLNFKLPFIENIAGKVSLRVLQLDVKVETKSQDNVFITVNVSVQYNIIPDKIYNAFYRLNNPTTQINSYIFDVVRAKAPKINLDDLFEKKDEIAIAIKSELNETMSEFGFNIVNSLVTDIEVNPKVREAMNEINAAQRLRIAAIEKGEANKILQIKNAEADAQSKLLLGKGIADQRKAIIEGLQDSVKEFQGNVAGTSAKDVITLVLFTQYIDMIKEMGEKSKSNTILLPHNPAGMNSFLEEIQKIMITTNEVNKSSMQAEEK